MHSIAKFTAVPLAPDQCIVLVGQVCVSSISFVIAWVWCLRSLHKKHLSSKNDRGVFKDHCSKACQQQQQRVHDFACNRADYDDQMYNCRPPLHMSGECTIVASVLPEAFPKFSLATLHRTLW
jgi:hypothetical protein